MDNYFLKMNPYGIFIHWYDMISKFRWIVKMVGSQDTLYSGEQFTLQFKFSSKYPFDSPEVIKGAIFIYTHFY